MESEKRVRPKSCATALYVYVCMIPRPFRRCYRRHRRHRRRPAPTSTTIIPLVVAPTPASLSLSLSLSPTVSRDFSHRLFFLPCWNRDVKPDTCCMRCVTAARTRRCVRRAIETGGNSGRRGEKHGERANGAWPKTRRDTRPGGFKNYVRGLTFN